MKMNKAFNISLVVAVIIILAVFAFYVRVGATADAVAVLRTSGMTCGSCIKKVNKALQSQRGVAATEVDLENGIVFAGYDSKIVNPEKLARKVTESGFATKVQTVVTPEQFRRIVGHDVGRQADSGQGCCGSKGCGGK